MARLELDVRLTQGTFEVAVYRAMDLSGVTAVFGPSGAGKSSLLRVIAGLERGATGRVALEGRVLQDSGAGIYVPPHRRGIGMVFQDARLFPHLTVSGNLSFAEKRSQGRAPARNDVIDLLELAPLLGQMPSSLSGGERQRVALARALLAGPGLLLMDEPLTGLDLRRKAQILPYIERLPGAFGVPVLYVTHSIDEVTRVATRMVALRAGHVVAEGPLAETFARLDIDGGASRFEGGVILSARVTGHDLPYRLTRLELDGQHLTMPHAEVEPGADVQLRVRARDVMLSLAPPQGISAQNCLQGQITEVLAEADTAFAEVFLTVGTRPQVLRARVTRAAVDQMGLAPGQQVYAVLKAISFDRRVL